MFRRLVPNRSNKGGSNKSGPFLPVTSSEASSSFSQQHQEFSSSQASPLMNDNTESNSDLITNIPVEITDDEKTNQTLYFLPENEKINNEDEEVKTNQLDTSRTSLKTVKSVNQALQQPDVMPIAASFEASMNNLQVEVKGRSKFEQTSTSLPGLFPPPPPPPSPSAEPIGEQSVNFFPLSNGALSSMIQSPSVPSTSPVGFGNPNNENTDSERDSLIHHGNNSFSNYALFSLFFNRNLRRSNENSDSRHLLSYEAQIESEVYFGKLYFKTVMFLIFLLLASSFGIIFALYYFWIVPIWLAVIYTQGSMLILLPLIIMTYFYLQRTFICRQYYRNNTTISFFNLPNIRRTYLNNHTTPLLNKKTLLWCLMSFIQLISICFVHSIRQHHKPNYSMKNDNHQIVAHLKLAGQILIIVCQTLTFVSVLNDDMIRLVNACRTFHHLKTQNYGSI